MDKISNEFIQKVVLLERNRDILADRLAEIKENLDALNDNLITLSEFKECVEQNINDTIKEI